MTAAGVDNTPVVGDRDLPALFQSADHASARAKRDYSGLVAWDLILAVGAGLLGAIATANASIRVFFGIGAGVAVGAGAVLTIFIWVLKLEEQWYGARAIAESVKTLAWKYITGAEPFAITLGQRKADENFAKTLGEVLAERKRLAWDSGGDTSAAAQVTNAMRRIRGESLEVRKNVYIASRVQEQRKWYAVKSRGNNSFKQKWFVAVVLCQLAALGASVALVLNPASSLNLTGALAAAAASLLAWINVRRYQELGQSYGLAAHELGIVAIRAEHVKTDDELSEFVSDAESAMSREHTMWVARREDV